ncbi:MAG: inorganic phosphate transporter, partial [Bacteroidia bacterium]|nr:inorganic phosphate transporter [Bacteroidia bacterium]
VKRGSKLYRNSIDGLAKQNLDQLKKNKGNVYKLSTEVEDLRDHLFYFIKNLEDSSTEASNFYMNILGYLTDFTQSIEYITKISHKHVNNNHKKLKYNQVKDLTEINSDLEKLLSSTKQAYDNRSFEEIGLILDKKQELYDRVSEKIAVQIARTREEDSSPKNTTLYFSILLETKDLITATNNLLQEYYDKADLYNDPAIVPVESAEVEE